jgi:predicted DNA-binding transcriptional regulator
VLAQAREPTVLRAQGLLPASFLAEVNGDKEIAAELVISQRTAENHVEHILAKLGFTARAQVAAWVAASQPDGEGRLAALGLAALGVQASVG